MVLVNGKLAAILVHRSDRYSDPGFQGKWFIKAGFGLLFGKHLIFTSFEEVVAWVRQQFEKRGKTRTRAAVAGMRLQIQQLTPPKLRAPT